MGGRSLPKTGSNPPGFLQMPEMSWASNGRFFVGESFSSCFCLPPRCAKRICVKADTVTRAKATNHAMKRYFIFRLPLHRRSPFPIRDSFFFACITRYQVAENYTAPPINADERR